MFICIFIYIYMYKYSHIYVYICIFSYLYLNVVDVPIYVMCCLKCTKIHINLRFMLDVLEPVQHKQK